jgi:hypothetical protein
VHEIFWLYARKALSAVSMQEACGDSVLYEYELVQPCFQPKSAAGPGEISAAGHATAPHALPMAASTDPALPGTVGLQGVRGAHAAACEADSDGISRHTSSYFLG